ncbi:hypothetical protein N202_01640 [Helicobacter pylori UM067]|nr:hypothetical protein N202_01640 [Helicobacter pylori UM067]
MDSKEYDGFLTNGQNIRELKQSNSIYKVGVGEKWKNMRF